VTSPHHGGCRGRGLGLTLVLAFPKVPRQNTGHDYPSFGTDVSGMTIETKDAVSTPEERERSLIKKTFLGKGIKLKKKMIK
jgi:hypothetical protein